MKHTFKERLCAGLEAEGRKQVPHRSGKYVAYNHDKTGLYYFVGSNGALRMGPCATQSHSIGDATQQGPRYLNLLGKGDAALEASQPKSATQQFAELLKTVEGGQTS